ncbi:MAG: hypothetical protein QNJ51_27230 [Calothrix sp. MO_167.B12]|nr:hypothetical protein [Calothrix sp. MO_167.B12]
MWLFLMIPDGISARLCPKLITCLSLQGKNPGFLAKHFSISLIDGDIQKFKLTSHKGLSFSICVTKKWIKSSLEASWQQLLQRNQNRTHRVPEKVLYKMRNRLQVPNITEAHQVDWVMD